MPIYTGRGDRGETDLWSSEEKISKASPRIEATGKIDELISLLGYAATTSNREITEEIEPIQNQLCTIISQLADVEEKGNKKTGKKQIKELERKIDEYSSKLSELKRFLIPGGSEGGSILHYARAVCRNAERKVIKLNEEEKIDENVIVYLNRLSDFLFVMARYQNKLDNIEEKKVDYD